MNKDASKFEESEKAKKLMDDFCHEVQRLGPHLTGVCGIDSPEWDTSLSQGYGIENFEEMNEIVANILDALCMQYGWGPDELFEFVEKAIFKVSESMRSRLPGMGLPPS